MCAILSSSVTCSGDNRSLVLAFPCAIGSITQAPALGFLHHKTEDTLAFLYGVQASRTPLIALTRFPLPASCAMFYSPLPCHRNSLGAPCCRLTNIARALQDMIISARLSQQYVSALRWDPAHSCLQLLLCPKTYMTPADPASSGGAGVGGTGPGGPAVGLSLPPSNDGAAALSGGSGRQAPNKRLASGPAAEPQGGGSAAAPAPAHGHQRSGREQNAVDRGGSSKPSVKAAHQLAGAGVDGEGQPLLKHNSLGSSSQGSIAVTPPSGPPVALAGAAAAAAGVHVQAGLRAGGGAGGGGAGDAGEVELANLPELPGGVRTLQDVVEPLFDLLEALKVRLKTAPALVIVCQRVESG